jgi:hypothetical protein
LSCFPIWKQLLELARPVEIVEAAARVHGAHPGQIEEVMQAGGEPGPMHGPAPAPEEGVGEVDGHGGMSFTREAAAGMR